MVSLWTPNSITGDLHEVYTFLTTFFPFWYLRECNKTFQKKWTHYEKCFN